MQLAAVQLLQSRLDRADQELGELAPQLAHAQHQHQMAASHVALLDEVLQATGADRDQFATHVGQLVEELAAQSVAGQRHAEELQRQLRLTETALADVYRTKTFRLARFAEAGVRAAEAVTARQLVVAAVAAPRVSVVVVLYGRADLGLQAVAALIDNTPPCWELIIVDNASPDGAIEVLGAQVSGATVIRNGLNVGFSAAVSVGALHARGEFVLILNSDVFVEPGWLPPLIAALDADNTLAGVSPTLFNLDGTVQEAGSVLYASAETRAVMDDDRWALEFTRAVPYVSAACLLMRRLVYTQLGGMDTVYGRGYFEDVDLALELEALGLSLAHVPGSSARHVRGGSSTPESATSQMVLNRTVFVDRWSQRLSLLPHFGTDSVGARRRGRDACPPWTGSWSSTSACRTWTVAAVTLECGRSPPRWRRYGRRRG